MFETFLYDIGLNNWQLTVSIQNEIHNSRNKTNISAPIRGINTQKLARIANPRQRENYICGKNSLQLFIFPILNLNSQRFV
jgi:hypothetical protein